MSSGQDEAGGSEPEPPPRLDYRVYCRFEYCRWPPGECPHPE